MPWRRLSAASPRTAAEGGLSGGCRDEPDRVHPAGVRRQRAACASVKKTAAAGSSADAADPVGRRCRRRARRCLPGATPSRPVDRIWRRRRGGAPATSGTASGRTLPQPCPMTAVEPAASTTAPGRRPATAATPGSRRIRSTRSAGTVPPSGSGTVTGRPRRRSPWTVMVIVAVGDDDVGGGIPDRFGRIAQPGLDEGAHRHEDHDAGGQGDEGGERPNPARCRNRRAASPIMPSTHPAAAQRGQLLGDPVAPGLRHVPHDPPVGQQQHAVGVRGGHRVVGDHDDGLPVLVDDRAQQRQHVRARSRCPARRSARRRRAPRAG